ncbi:carbohydrate ABC transporter permease [Microbacterium esteraromaticum]|uniref:carbohydrate ABC transporter permease n=1 Tax=Microbacterium esteraromaticum TaxID=57043 RepID=UPI001CD3761F|nr:carbohydrate ABC transporter permease [Microbacterium esteraromaticum]MCA1306694.1 carbohydrate ABC transporter permease [Microbacterium esteraromaticum]
MKTDIVEVTTRSSVVVDKAALRRESRRPQGRGWPRLGDSIAATVLIVFCLMALLPFAFMVVTSLQRTNVITIFLDPAKLELSNYVRLFTENGFGAALVTSIGVVVLACVVNAIVCSFAAYAFAKRPFPGSEALFWLYVATMMVPAQVTLIPLFTIMRDLGLLNTWVSLFLPVINAFGVFLIRQFMSSIPDEMLEAARIDGASEMQLFFRIVLPSMKPVIVALTIFTFLTTWNDFLWPLVSITNDRMQTVTLAVAKLQGRLLTDYGIIMAGATVSFLVPLIVYFVLQKQFVEGVTSSSVKG